MNAPSGLQGGPGSHILGCLDFAPPRYVQGAILLIDANARPWRAYGHSTASPTVDRL